MAEGALNAMANLNLEPARDFNTTVAGKSTLYSFTIKPDSVAYRYDVKIVKNPDDPRRAKELTKQNEPGLRSAQRQCCSDIMEALHSKTLGFNVDCKFVYDGKAVLFTNKEIKIRQENRLEWNDLIARAAIFVRREAVRVTITPNEAAPKLNYSDLKPALVADVTAQADRSVRTFLELLTSQYMINSDEYQYVKAGCLFENRTTRLAEGMEMRVGIQKGVRITGDPKNPKAVCVVDMKRTAFFARQNLVQIYNQFVRDPNDRRGQTRFASFMKGVRAVITYDTSRTIIIGRTTQFAVNNPQYVVNRMTVPEYMRTTKGITLNYPGMVGIHPDQPNGERIVYPMEVLEVLHGQLVPIERLTSFASQRLLMENSVRPNDRFAYVEQQVRAIATRESATFLNHFNVKLNLDNDVEIHNRRLPRIIVGGNKQITPDVEGNWFKEATNFQFVAPSNKLKNWIVVYDQVDERNVKRFVERITQNATASGMTLPRPQRYIRKPGGDIEPIFKQHKGEIQFILFIDDLRTKSHGSLKLYEAYYKILTQHIASKTLTASSQTMQNVVMKLNTKTFGLCYAPTVDPSIKQYALDEKDLLIIGLDMSHPHKLSPKEKFDLKKTDPGLQNKHPSVVAVSANKTVNPWGFAGDFFYQQSRRDAISPTRLRKAIREAVETARKVDRAPKRVLVYRDGLSEGAHQLAATVEVPAVRQGIRDVYPSEDPKITFVVATKDHNKRYYRSDGKSLRNTMAGDIVDSAAVVRGDIPEFYQQTHKAIKGVPKMMQVTFLANDLNMSQGEVQKVTQMLASMHQVAALTTSLPLPLYLSDETAKRGMEIYNELYFKRFHTGRNSPAANFAPEITAQRGIFNVDELTKFLGYSQSGLVGTRFNA